MEHRFVFFDLDFAEAIHTAHVVHAVHQRIIARQLHVRFAPESGHSAMLYARAWRIDHMRFAQEQLPPLTYLSASYYQRWLLGMEKNIIERGLATAEELKAGHATTAGKMLGRKLTVSVFQVMRPSYFRQQQAPARFKPGDRVRARNIHPKTHTRLPRYARGKLGVVERCQGCHMYPDSVAVDQGDNPQWLYTVVFTGNELWGPDADPTVQVSIEAFEPYLESA